MEQGWALPPELSNGAVLHGREYTWRVDRFQEALELAPVLAYACLGGQFWVLPSPSEIYELFWIEANSSERLPKEPWQSYAERSCREVLKQFEALLKTVDFSQEIIKFKSLDPLQAGSPVFNAYFVSEQEWLSLQPRN